MGAPSGLNRSTPSTWIVGDPLNPSSSASSGVATSRHLSSKPISACRATSRFAVVRQCGQPSRYKTSTFIASDTLNLPVHWNVKGGSSNEDRRGGVAFGRAGEDH